MYTENYLKAEAKFKNCETEFKNNPSTKTATKLAQARVDLQNCQKFTDEYIKFCDREHTKDLLESITLFDRNSIL